VSSRCRSTFLEVSGRWLGMYTFTIIQSKLSMVLMIVLCVPFFENLVFVDGCYPCFVQEDVGAFSFVEWEVDEENGISCCFFEVSDRLWCAMILGHKL